MTIPRKPMRGACSQSVDTCFHSTNPADDVCGTIFVVSGRQTKGMERYQQRTRLQDRVATLHIGSGHSPFGCSIASSQQRGCVYDDPVSIHLRISVVGAYVLCFRPSHFTSATRDKSRRFPSNKHTCYLLVSSATTLRGFNQLNI